MKTLTQLLVAGAVLFAILTAYVLIAGEGNKPEVPPADDREEPVRHLPMTPEIRRVIDGFIVEGRKSYQAGDLDAAIRHGERALQLLRDRGRILEAAELLDEIGLWYAENGEPLRGAHYYLAAYVQATDEGSDEGRRIAREAEDLHQDLVMNLSDAGRVEEAEKILEPFLKLYRRRGDRLREAQLLHNHAWVLSDNGRYQEAVERYERSLAIRRALDDREGQAWTLNNLGYTLMLAKRWEASAGRLFESLEAAGDEFPQVRRKAGDNLVLLAERARDAEAHDVSLSVTRRLVEGLTDGTAWYQADRIRVVRAKTLRAAGRYADARAVLETLRERSREERYDYGVAVHTFGIGRTFLAEGRTGEALAAFQEALEIQQRIGDVAGAAWTHASAGAALAKAGRHEEAVARYRKALACFEEAGRDPKGMAETHRGLATSLKALGRPREAERASARAEEFEKAPAPEDLQREMFMEDLERRNFVLRTMQRDDVMARVVREEEGWRFIDVPTQREAFFPLSYRGRHVVFQGIDFRLEGSRLVHQGYHVFMSPGDEAALTVAGRFLRRR